LFYFVVSTCDMSSETANPTHSLFLCTGNTSPGAYMENDSQGG